MSDIISPLGGISSPFGQSRFNPASLFATAGSRGFFYDFSDYSTQFTDTAGTNRITGTGQSLALVLDKSQGMALGSELVTNGDFSAGITGWTDNSTAPATFTAPSGAGLLTANGTARARARTTFTTVVGRTYRILFQASASVDYSIGTSPAAGDIAAGASSNLSILFVATTTTTHLQISTIANGVTSFDNVSVRELAGNHATQGTAGSQPLTVIRPLSVERRNLAIGSGDVGNASYWINTSTVNGITATRVASGFDIDGLPYVDFSVVGTCVTATSGIAVYFDANSRVPATLSQTYTASAIVRRLSGTAPSANNGVRTEVVGETAPTTQTEILVSTAIAPTTDTVVTTSLPLANAATNQARCGLVIRTAVGETVNYTVRIKALQFELGSTRTTYQRVITANEWYQEGLQSYRGIQTDGVDDFMQTAAIDFEGAVTATGSELFGGSFIPSIQGGTATATESPAGTLNITGDGTNQARGDFQLSTVAGRAYVITVNCANTVASYVLGTAQGGNTINPGTLINVGANRIVFTAVSSTTWVRFYKSAATLSVLSGVSAKEGVGHADKVTVIVGLRKLSDAARGTVVELTNAATGRFSLEAPQGAAANYGFASGGSAPLTVTTPASFAAPDTAVITGLGDISGDSAILRRNGVQVGSSVADQGTGNYSNAIVYLFRRGGTSLPANVICTFMMVINRVLTASEIAQIEAYANARTGAF